MANTGRRPRHAQHERERRLAALLAQDAKLEDAMAAVGMKPLTVIRLLDRADFQAIVQGLRDGATPNPVVVSVESHRRAA